MILREFLAVAAEEGELFLGASKQVPGHKDFYPGVLYQYDCGKQLLYTRSILERDHRPAIIVLAIRIEIG